MKTLSTKPKHFCHSAHLLGPSNLIILSKLTSHDIAA